MWTYFIRLRAEMYTCHCYSNTDIPWLWPKNNIDVMQKKIRCEKGVNLNFVHHFLIHIEYNQCRFPLGKNSFSTKCTWDVNNLMNSELWLVFDKPSYQWWKIILTWDPVTSRILLFPNLSNLRPEGSLDKLSEILKHLKYL